MAGSLFNSHATPFTWGCLTSVCSVPLHSCFLLPVLTPPGSINLLAPCTTLLCLLLCYNLQTYYHLPELISHSSTHFKRCLISCSPKLSLPLSLKKQVASVPSRTSEVPSTAWAYKQVSESSQLPPWCQGALLLFTCFCYHFDTAVYNMIDISVCLYICLLFITSPVCGLLVRCTLTVMPLVMTFLFPDINRYG